MSEKPRSYHWPQSHNIGKIVVERVKTSDPHCPVKAEIDLGAAGSLWLADAAIARQLVDAALEAYHILDADGVAQRLAEALKSIEGTVECPWCAGEGRVREGAAPPDLTSMAEAAKAAKAIDVTVLSAGMQACFWCGCQDIGMQRCATSGDYADKWECTDAEECRHRCAVPAQKAAPDVAQPSILPIPSCAHCHHDAESVPLVLVDGEWECHDRGLCDGRQAEARIADRRAGMS